MKLTYSITSALVLVGLLASTVTDAKLFGKDPVDLKDPSTWSLDETKAWLESHNIPYPETSYTKDDLLELVKTNADWAARNAAHGAGVGQAYFEVYSDKAVDAWSESQVREYLLEQGIVSPTGSIEQLRIAAKQRASAISTAIYGKPTDQIGSSLSSAYHGAPSAASSYASGVSSAAHAYATDKSDQVTAGVEGLYARIREALGSGIVYAEDQLYSVLDILNGAKQSPEEALRKGYASVSSKASAVLSSASVAAESLAASASSYASVASASAVSSAASVSSSASSAASSISSSWSSVASSASSVASKSGNASASSAASVASKSYSSMAAQASASAASVASAASKTAAANGASLSSSASSLSKYLQSSASVVSASIALSTKSVSQSLSSAYSVASRSASSLSSISAAASQSAKADL